MRKLLIFYEQGGILFSFQRYLYYLFISFMKTKMLSERIQYAHSALRQALLLLWIHIKKHNPPKYNCCCEFKSLCNGTRVKYQL